MKINVSKSMCVRFGPRFNVDCAELISLYGGALKWVSSCQYLGVYLVSGRTFKCYFSNAKARFFRAFNAMYGKLFCNYSMPNVYLYCCVICNRSVSIVIMW